ncbi:hypothetical protein ACWEG1_29290 [Streptomyces bauhiniae]
MNDSCGIASGAAGIGACRPEVSSLTYVIVDTAWRGLWTAPHGGVNALCLSQIGNVRGFCDTP